MLTGQHLDQVLCQVLTQWGTQSPCLHGICRLQRERGALQPPGVMGAVRGGPGARGLEVASSPRHWGTSLPGEEHQNQEVKAGWQGEVKGERVGVAGTEAAHTPEAQACWPPP